MKPQNVTTVDEELSDIEKRDQEVEEALGHHIKQKENVGEIK